jgi:REP element-mobilizing transposase RayT
MAQLGRTFLPDQPLHVITRGNSRGAVLFGEDDDAQYGSWLAEAADGYGCRIHADVFMADHVHLLFTPSFGTWHRPNRRHRYRRRYVCIEPRCFRKPPFRSR